MKDLFGYFDEYTLKARFLPACIAGLPLLALIASYFDWNKFLISNVIVGVLNRASSLNHFLRTESGFKITAPEGFVAINSDGNAVKLVDRLEFAAANFSKDVLKGWQK